MTRTGKTLAVILLTAIIVFGMVIWNLTPAETEPTRLSEETTSAESDQLNSRRARKGPRKPPPIAQAENPEDETGPTEDPSPEPVADHSPAPLDREEKLEEYLEHLEALDNPNVDELTMLGEMAFDANEAEAAYEHYLEVIEEHTNDPSAPFALYKLAWAEYNLGDVEAAIDDMELVIEWIEGGQTGLDEVLRKAAPTDLERFRSEDD
jgi:tetratricopeptide (TPR) repeat protein